MEHKPHDSEGAERFKRYAVPGTESTLKLRNGQVQLKPVQPLKLTPQNWTSQHFGATLGILADEY